MFVFVTFDLSVWLLGGLLCCVQFNKLRVVIQSAGGEAILCNNDGGLLCCVQFNKLRVVIQSAGGEAILCNNDGGASDAALLSDRACIMWSDVLHESDPARRSWIQRIQQLLTRFLTRVYLILFK